MTFSSFTPQTSPWCSFTLSLSLPLSLSLCLYLFLVYLFRNLSSLPSFLIVLTIRFFYQPWTILRFLSLPSSFSFCLMHTLSFFSDVVYFLVTSVSAQMKMFILVFSLILSLALSKMNCVSYFLFPFFQVQVYFFICEHVLPQFKHFCESP